MRSAVFLASWFIACPPKRMGAHHYPNPQKTGKRRPHVSAFPTGPRASGPLTGGSRSTIGSAERWAKDPHPPRYARHPLPQCGRGKKSPLETLARIAGEGGPSAKRLVGEGRGLLPAARLQ